MTPAAAWAVIIVGFVLPVLHVALTPSLKRPTAPSAPARGAAAQGSCPFSARVGWLVIVLFLGPIGWLMFMASRRRKRRAAVPAPSQDSAPS